ncbi:MAG: alpha-2-macroglobulin family protein, partial [Acidobacteriota bacterium]
MKRIPGRPLVASLLLSAFFLSASALGAESLLLTAPQRLTAGGKATITLTRGLKFSPKRRSMVSLELVTADGIRIPVFSNRRFSLRQQLMEFDVPALVPGTYLLRIRSQAGAILESEVELTSTPALLIETDRPIYLPGETLRGRVLRLDQQLRPSAGPLELVISDGKGVKIARLHLRADSFGVAPFELPLANELNEGFWKLEASNEGVRSQRDVRVEKVVLPRFGVFVETDRSWALPTQSISGQGLANYFFGKQVEGRFQLTASRWVGLWEVYAEQQGEVRQGRFEFTLPPPQFVSGTPQRGNEGSVKIDVRVLDSLGNPVEASLTVRIVQDELVLKLDALQSVVKPGIPLEILGRLENPDFEDAAGRVELEATFFGEHYDRVGTSRLEVEVEGSFRWSVMPPSGTLFADFEARSGPRAFARFRLGGAVSGSGEYLTLVRVDGSGPLQIGETARFQVQASQPGTTYYEVFAGGRTVFAAFTEGNQFSFPVTPEMLPAARVVSYRLSPSNEVAADSVQLQVALTLEATIKAAFGAQEVRPGDPVEVVLDTGLGRRALLGVSIVDQSMLFLGRSRLRLEEVFEGLEERFLAPVAAPPGGLPEFDLAVAVGIPFGADIPLQGAADVFQAAGMVVAATQGVSIPEGRRISFLEAIEDLSPPPPSSGPESNGSDPTAPRLRQFCPATWFWNPTLLTDDEGKARLQLTAPDSITGWRLSVVSTHQPQDGEFGIGFGEAELKVFQEFFVEPSLPVSVVRGEVFPLKLDVFNFSDDPQTVTLELSEAPGLKLLGENPLRLEVPANGTASAQFPLRPERVGKLHLQVLAEGSSGADAVLRLLEVVAEGLPSEKLVNGVLEAGERVELMPSAPPEAVEDSVRAFLSLTPSLIGQAMTGLDDLLEMPYGCGEQNMIFLAPDIEVLKYLREVGELEVAIRAQAEHFVNTGYQRELTFQTDDGGFAAFAGPEGSLWLTAFVLSSFSGAREVTTIDRRVLADAAAMLLSRQRPDGSFQPDRFLIHTEMAGNTLLNDYATAAYVANALADYNGPEVQQALGRAASYLVINRTARPDINDNGYVIAIASAALSRISGFEAAAESFLDRLIELAVRQGEGLHWEPYPVEATGWAVQALLNSSDPERAFTTQQALDFLMTQRNSRGGLGYSTQDTVVGLRALFEAARNLNRSLDLQVTARSGGQALLDLRLQRDNFDLLHQIELPLGVPLVLTAQGQGKTNFQMAVRYNRKGLHLPPPRDLFLDVVYDSQGIEVDD